MNNNNLITVSNYARSKGVTVTTVYRWIASGTVKSEKIDGVTFVRT